MKAISEKKSLKVLVMLCVVVILACIGKSEFVKAAAEGGSGNSGVINWNQNFTDDLEMTDAEIEAAYFGEWQNIDGYWQVIISKNQFVYAILDEGGEPKSDTIKTVSWTYDGVATLENQWEKFGPSVNEVPKSMKALHFIDEGNDYYLGRGQAGNGEGVLLIAVSKETSEVSMAYGFEKKTLDSADERDLEYIQTYNSIHILNVNQVLAYYKGIGAEELKTPVKPVTPEITVKGKVSSAKITVTAEKADGYRIYMSEKKLKGYKRVKSKAVTDIKYSYTKKKLTAGATYYFKARVYKLVDGKKVWSDYSSVVSVKVK